MKSEILDPEFGVIIIRRTKLARGVRLKYTSSGQISISMPVRTSLYVAKNLIESSREELRRIIAQVPRKTAEYSHGQLIGKSHYLDIRPGKDYSHRLAGNKLVIELPQDHTPIQAQATIKQGVAKALRHQAKKHLPNRLEQLSNQHNFSYQKLRFSSAHTRWGSCTSHGTISLTIWLMALPFELIDYVIIHELCHTKEMNHSPKFWQLVESCQPNYLQLKKELKSYSTAM